MHDGEADLSCELKARQGVQVNALLRGTQKCRPGGHNLQGAAASARGYDLPYGIKRKMKVWGF